MSDVFNIDEITIVEIHQAMRDGRLTCRKLAETYCDRILAYDQQGPALNAVIMINPHWCEEADALDAALKHSGPVGPLHGIPVLVKDNIDTDFMPTTAGSASLAGFTPQRNAAVIQRLLAAGALILAKVNLHEFAIWGETISSVLGQTLNPYDLTRTPGGSSGGTGAAIAANYGVIGLGTDTVNSVRSPASACALTAIRPTVGLVSRAGVVPYSMTQDTAGPLTRCLTDAAKTLSVLAGYDPEDPETSWCVGKIPERYADHLQLDGLKGKRIGILRCFFCLQEHAPVNLVMESALAVFRRQGAQLVEVTEKFQADDLIKRVSVHLYDLHDHLNEYLGKLGADAPVHSLEDILNSGKYHPGIEADLRQALLLSTDSEEYRYRLLERRKLRTAVMKLMADYKIDALLFPHQKCLVVEVGQGQADRNGVLGAVTGFPSVIVPAGFSAPTATAPLGVPVGLELLGRPWSEPLLIEMGYGFEQATKWRQPPRSTPPLPVT